MKLTQITARNFKGLNFTLDLASINFLVGANFAGKSARTDAIRLLLLGYLPELGKTAKATFGLSSGREMEVSGLLDGKPIFRRWTLKGDSVKTEEEITRLDMAEEVVGQLAVMLNAETYFALSDRERINYVFANTGISSEKILSDIEAATERAKEAKAAASNMDKTAKGLATLRAEDAPQIDIGALDAQRVELVAAIEQVEAAKAADMAAFDQARKNRQRREQLTKELTGKAALEVRIEKLRESLEAAKAALASCPFFTQADQDEIAAREREASIAVRSYARDLTQVTESIDANTRELNGVDAKESCPYCGAKGEGWKALKTGEINSALAGLRTKREQLTAHCALLEKAHGELVAALKHAKDARELHRDRSDAVQTVKNDLSAAETSLASLVSKADELSRIPAEDPAVTARVETAQTTLNVKRAELSALDQQRKNAMGRANDLKRLAEAEIEREKAQKEESAAKAELETLREKQRKMVEDAFKPLLETANAFFASVLKTPLAYNDGEIGTWRDGVWVGHRTFSGTEKALCYAAIQAALASKSPVRIMILDELGRLDDFNTGSVQACVERAIERGLIDQFVGIDAGRANHYREVGKLNSQVIEI